MDEAVTAPLTIERAVELAVTRNERSAIADTTVEAAEARVRRARTAFLPRVDISGNLRSDIGNGSERDVSAAALLTQPIFDARAFPLYRQQRFERDAAVLSAADSKRVLGFDAAGVVKAAGYTTADDLVGHYVGSKPHGDPQVPNHGTPKRGPKLLPGLTIAIEPMVNIGKSATRTLKDKWTIVTLDGSRSAHFEHTVAVTESGPRVLTQSASLIPR